MGMMQTFGMSVDNEQRRAKRKVLKVKAKLVLEGAQPLMARTADVGADGVSLVLPNVLKTGTTCMVHFDIFHDGKAATINARSRVQYCVLSNGEFKVGFQFLHLELAALASLSKFLH